MILPDEEATYFGEWECALSKSKEAQRFNMYLEEVVEEGDGIERIKGSIIDKNGNS